MKTRNYIKGKKNKYSKIHYISLNVSNKKTNFKKIIIYSISTIVLFTIIFFVIFIIKNHNSQLNNNEKNFLSKLKNILNKEEIFENEMMNRHTTFELGGPAKFFIIPNSINKIINVIKLCKKYNIEYFVLGNGSNLLVSDKGYNSLVIKINENNFSELNVKEIDDKNNKVTVGGGILMKTLAKKMCLLSLSGLEDIIDIPGTIGGGIIMNANMMSSSIYNTLEKVKAITSKGEMKELTKEECQLRYRGSMLKDNKYIVIEATFNLIKKDKMLIQKDLSDLTSLRYSKQPMYFPSAGSFFMWDHQKFGSLYEKYKISNLVGYKVGDAMLYDKNIAFIVNLGKAKSSDVYEIVTHIEQTFKTKFNIDIKREVIVLGSFS